MSEPDVVDALEVWIAKRVVDAPPHSAGEAARYWILQRARDEIVALRAEVDSDKRFEATVRAEALEEAARVCETHDPSRETRNCAAAIRALKDRGDE